MSFVTWGNKYRIGVEGIDQEHRYLFDLINEFHDTHSAGADRYALQKILNRLVHYAEQHFRHEEEIMQAAAYPAHPMHCKLHDELYLTIFRLSEQLAAGSLNANRETTQFIRNWLVNHILKHDLQFAGYLAGRANLASNSSD
jgi:hemerythrin-like metal-binding protein